MGNLRRVLLGIMVVAGLLTVFGLVSWEDPGDIAWRQLNDCHEHIELLVDAPAAGPVAPPSAPALDAATACSGVEYEGRIYPNLLLVTGVDIDGLHQLDAVRNGFMEWTLVDDHAYRVPGVSEETAIFVWLADLAPDSVGIAWRKPFPVTACALLSPTASRRPAACQ